MMIDDDIDDGDNDDDNEVDGDDSGDDNDSDDDVAKVQHASHRLSATSAATPMLRAAAAFVGETTRRAKTELQLAKPPHDDDGKDDDDKDDDGKGGHDDGDHISNADGGDGTVAMDLRPRAAQKQNCNSPMVMIMMMHTPRKAALGQN